MNIRKRNRKKIIWVGAAAFMLCAALTYILVTKPFSKDESSPPTTSQSVEAQKQAEANADANTKKALIENEDPSQPETQSQSIELSAAQETNSVTVFTKLYSVSSGTCNLRITNGSASNNQEASVIYQSEYSTCAGFNVPVTGLGSGTWNLSLSVNSGGQTLSKDITYEVK